MVPKSCVTRVLIKEGSVDTEETTESRWPCEDGGRDGGTVYKTRSTWAPTWAETRRGALRGRPREHGPAGTSDVGSRPETGPLDGRRRRLYGSQRPAGIGLQRPRLHGPIRKWLLSRFLKLRHGN